MLTQQIGAEMYDENNSGASVTVTFSL